MKKKVLSVILSTAMIASVLAGCGGGSEAPAADGGSAEAEAPATDSAAGGAEEITWMFWDDLNATEDLISLGYKDTVERFNKDYEGKYHACQTSCLSRRASTAVPSIGRLPILRCLFPEPDFL